MSQLGDTIKKRRLAMGQSRGQLASSLGTTATVVASFERGERVPDGETVAKLAKAFGVEPGALTGDAAAPEVDVADATALVAAAPAPVAAPPPRRHLDGGPAADPAPRRETPGGRTPTVFEEMDRIPVVPAGAAAARTAPPAIAGRPTELVEAPTEAVPLVDPLPVVVSTAPERPAPEPAAGVYASFHRFLAVVFDRDKPYLFWIRATLTVIALLVGLRVLAWAVPALFDALGDILSTIESTNPTPTTIPGS